MSNKTLIIGSIVVGVGLMIFAWLFNGNGSPRTAGIHGGIPNSGSQTSTKEKAPDFSLELLSGGTITLAEYNGEKPVILDFWASWCPNCRRDMPRLNRWYEKYKDRVEVIGINLQENPSVVERYVSSTGISFPIALDPRGSASRAYGVRYTNFHVLIDKDGNVVRVVPGDIREADILSLINSS